MIPFRRTNQMPPFGRVLSKAPSNAPQIPLLKKGARIIPDILLTGLACIFKQELGSSNSYTFWDTFDQLLRELSSQIKIKRPSVSQ